MVAAASALLWSLFAPKSAKADVGEGQKKGAGVTWTPKVCRIIAFGAVFRGFELSFYILLGFR